MGMNTAISDKVIDDILLENRLQKLETLTIQGCSQVNKNMLNNI